MKKETKKHATAEKILDAAKDIFMAKGFQGSSINDIAQKANVHKSLIYHHFGSKEQLWKAVKTKVLEIHTKQDKTQIGFPTTSFKAFLKALVTFRFELYDKNPALARLISWQRLEKSKDKLQGVENEKLNTFIPQIKEFQRRGEIRPELDPEMIEYIIMTTPSMPFHEQPKFFQGNDAKKNKEKYLDMVIEGLYLAFSPSSKN